MADNRPVADADILSGFASLHEAISIGFTRIEGEFRSVRAEISAVEQRALRRFDAMDERFDAMDGRFDRMDRRFDAMDRRFEAINLRFDRLEMRVDQIERHMGFGAN